MSFAWPAGCCLILANWLLLLSNSDLCVEGGPLAADDAERDGGDELDDEADEAPRHELVGELRPQLVLVTDVLLLRHHLLDVQGSPKECFPGWENALGKLRQKW